LLNSRQKGNRNPSISPFAKGGETVRWTQGKRIGQRL
jgi:hypothetical protein